MRLASVLSCGVVGCALLGSCAQATTPGFRVGDDGGGLSATPSQGTQTATGGSANTDGGPSNGSTGNPSASGPGAATNGGDGAPPSSGPDGSPSSVVTSDGSSPASSGDAGPGSSGDSGGAPMLAGCPIFPADNPWNTRIDDPQTFPVHAQSATYLANMSPSTHLHADWGDWSTNHYGIPWQTVPAGQPGVPMTFTYSSESDPGPYPFPPNARIEGGAGSGGDMHVLVIDTGACLLYETWQSTYVGPGWSCGSGAKFDLRSNALRPDGWTSADAAGLSVLAGLVKVSEVMAGTINHALRFTVSSTQQAYIHPATHAAGKADTSLPPMGLRLRLKASFDLSPFQGPAKVILTAMKQYGLMLADNGSNWYITGDSDDGWTPLMSGIAQAFNQVHGSDFEAVDTGPLH